MSSVAEELQKQISRVRDEIMPVYQEIGLPGKPALFLMQRELDTAVKALAEGDAIACIRSLEGLKGFNL